MILTPIFHAFGVPLEYCIPVTWPYIGFGTLKRMGILLSPATSCHVAAFGACLVPPLSLYVNDFPFDDQLSDPASDGTGLILHLLVILLLNPSVGMILCLFKRPTSPAWGHWSWHRLAFSAPLLCSAAFVASIRLVLLLPFPCVFFIDTKRERYLFKTGRLK